MSTVSVPAYPNACIGPSLAASTVYLAGVPPSVEGRLEFYSIDLTNINSPTATLINSTEPAGLFWTSGSPKACYPYPGNQANPNNPMLMVQFGAKSQFTNLYPVSKFMDDPTGFTDYMFVSPKLFSISGAVGPSNWFTALLDHPSNLTGSSWSALRINATLTLDSQRDFVISQYPTATPLLSVGTFIPTSSTPAQGYQVVFDNGGGGVMYTSLDSAAPINNDQNDRILSLSSAQTVDMGGIILTYNAIPVTMVGVAYILDQAADGSTVIYSINPASGPKLQRVPVSGMVPPFSPSMSATALGGQIVTYGSSSTGSVSSTFNSFNTVAGSWSGPGLVQPAAIPSPSASNNISPTPSNNSNNSSSGKSTNVGAIAGGVVGGLVVIALIVFLFIRHRRRSNAAAASAAASATAAPAPVLNTATKPIFQAQPPLQQQQQQQQQPQMQQAYAYVTPQQAPTYNPHNSYMPYMDPSKDAYSPAPQHSAPPAQPPSPLIFQQQQHQQPTYSYTPPTLGIAAVEPQNPNIFQPQEASSDSGSNPSYTQAQYTPSTSAATPQTPYTPVANQAHTPSTGASSPQYVHHNNHGYVS
ncbi:hypothetical protein EMPS_05975 [Entomortierella parvispora]|uniref:Peptidase A1 domain-containing protein n=1 Tax=Entomortierella parvispora TaxID=205924 RepID=A0A9P3HBK3_9FUNG|nr:hypothetical protein EMPS_05975 [Entomortierella parvispora]